MTAVQRPERHEADCGERPGGHSLTRSQPATLGRVMVNNGEHGQRQEPEDSHDDARRACGMRKEPAWRVTTTAEENTTAGKAFRRSTQSHVRHHSVAHRVYREPPPSPGIRPTNTTATAIVTAAPAMNGMDQRKGTATLGERDRDDGLYDLAGRALPNHTP